MIRSGAMISAMTMISRVLGLVRDAVLANYFVIGGALDAFFVAFRIPNLLRRLFAEGAFSLAFVPVLSEYRETKSKEALKDLIDHVAGALAIILLIISVIGMIGAPLIIKLFTVFATEASDTRSELAVSLLRITFPYILFISLTAFLSGILNTFKQFAIPAFTPVLLNVVMIAAAVWWAPSFEEPVKALAWGVFIGGIVQLLFQIPALVKLGLVPRFRYKKAHKGVKRITKLMIPALFGSSVAQVNILINTAIAYALVSGSVSWLYFSDRFVELPLALIGVAIGTVILPKLSGDHANKAGKAFSSTLSWAIRFSLLMGIPAMVGLIILAKPILATVIDNGVNTWHDVEMASMSLMTYSLGLPAFILVKVLAPGFYSRQDTKTPVKIGIISMFSNMLLSLIIVFPWYKMGYVGAHAGLALATAMAAYINAGLLFYQLKKQNIYQPDDSSKAGWVKNILRITVAAIVMITVVWGINPVDSWWQDSGLLAKAGKLLILVVAAIVAYFGSLYLLGVRKSSLLA
jgi:putative peptidoglycan lipid II flippase